MREVPASITTNVQEESTTITFITDTSDATQQPQRWTTVTSLHNQVCTISLHNSCKVSCLSHYHFGLKYPVWFLFLPFFPDPHSI